MGPPDIAPGTLLIAPPTEDDDPVFRRAVILIVDREPNGITVGLVLNRPTDQHIADTSARALLFMPDFNAPTFWGGPMGADPAIVAQFADSAGLEWFHLAKRQLRPFPLPDVGVIAVAEHPEPFEGRIVRARLFVGLCVWGARQLESERAAGEWYTRPAAVDDLFRPDTSALWSDLLATMPDDD